MDAWLTAALGVPVERSYLAVDPRNKSARVRVVITDIDPAYTSYAAVPHDKQGVPLVVWSLEDAIRRYRPAPGCVRVPAEPYTTPELEAALDAAMAPEHIQPLFRAHSNIEYVMAARCGDDGEVPAVLVGVTAKGLYLMGKSSSPSPSRECVCTCWTGEHRCAAGGCVAGKMFLAAPSMTLDSARWVV